SEIVGALAQFIKQPRVLDGDDGLSGEILQEGNLFVGEVPNISAVNNDRADEVIVFQHRHAENTSCPARFHKSDKASVSFTIAGFSRYVGNMNNIFGYANASKRQPRVRMTQVEKRVLLP